MADVHLGHLSVPERRAGGARHRFTRQRPAARGLHYVTLACDWDGASPTSLIKSAREWVRPQHERTLTELVLFTADVANRLATRRALRPFVSGEPSESEWLGSLQERAGSPSASR